MSGQYVRDFDQIDNSGKYTPIKNDRCYPLFSTKFKQDKVATLKQGKMVGADIEMVEIIVAGDRTQTWYGKVTDEHRSRWPDFYKAWKAGEAPPVDGTSLEQWPLVSTSFLHELKSIGVRTIEQLANLTDTQAQSFMGGMGWRTKASEFLNKDGTAAEKTIRDLQKRLADLEAEKSIPQAALAAPIGATPDIASMVAEMVAKALAGHAPVSAVTKPKRVMSAEHKAKLAAGRARKAAAKEV